MRWLPLALCALVGGCPEERPKSTDNRCASASDCPTGSYCETGRGLCAVKAPVNPYGLVLHVSNLGGRDGGLSSFTFPAVELAGEQLERNLDVPAGVSVSGSLLGAGENPRPVRAEVTFTPHSDAMGFVATPTVVTTRDDADRPQNLAATLGTNVEYDVQIYPMNGDSLVLPPARTTYSSAEGDFVFSYAAAYEQLDVLAGTLVDEADVPQAGLWVHVLAGKRRTEREEPDEYGEDQVVSSLGIVAPNGEFSVNVLPGVIGEREYVLEVSLFEQRPWTTTIELDASRIDLAGDGPIYIPRIPARVSVEHRVETFTLVPAVDANVVFQSTYPVPEVPGAVNDRDWCEAKRLGDRGPAFRCRTLMATSTDTKGQFKAALLPGTYNMFVSPSRDTETGRNRLTVSLDLVVNTQAGGGPMEGQLHPLNSEAPVVRGSVLGFSGPIRNALVQLLPLSSEASDDVTAYSRASDGISDRRGAFAVPVDRGLFDFIARAPEGSGYPWLYKANRVIESSVRIGEFVLPPPVLVSGVVSVGEAPARGARIEAYALVRELGSGRERGALIGTATADEAGRYTLTLPPSVADED
jgi:hypothetical protein